MRIVALIAMCVVSLPGYAQDRAEFQKIADRFVQAYAKGDLNAVLQLYAEEASLLPPQAAMVKGRDAIAVFWKEEAQQSELRQVTVVEARPLGNNTAHVIFATAGRTRGTPPRDTQGKGAVLAQKAGDEWKMLVHIWNRNQPDQ